MTRYLHILWLNCREVLEKPNALLVFLRTPQLLRCIPQLTSGIDGHGHSLVA